MKYFSLIWISFLLFLGGCDYLDVVPKNDIQTIESIFEKKRRC